MEFEKFPSLVNTYQNSTLERIRHQIPPTTLFTACEKIHGANFSFWAKGDELRHARRSGFIPPDEKFFNFK